MNNGERGKMREGRGGGRRRRRRNAQKRRIIEEEEVDITTFPDIISAVLARWTLKELLRCCKVLLLLINNTGTHHCDYYQCFFVKYKYIQDLTVADYFAKSYKEARAALATNERHSHLVKLRACFIILMTFDSRVKRFVFSNHDIHFRCLSVVPANVKQSSRVIEKWKDPVKQVIDNIIEPEEMYNYCIKIWEDEMDRIL